MRCDGAFQVVELRPATSNASTMGAMELLAEARMSALIEMVGTKLKKGPEIEGMPAVQKDSELGRTLAYHRSSALIAQMAAEIAETCARDKAEAQEMRERVEARNDLKNYVLSIRNQLLLGRTCAFNKLTSTYNPSDPLSGYVAEGDKSKIQKALAEAEKQLEHGQSAKKELFEDKLRRLKDVCSPIISKIYEETGIQPPSWVADDGERCDLELRALEEKRALVAKRSNQAAKAYQEKEHYARKITSGVERLNRYTIAEQKERKGKARARWGLAGGTVKTEVASVLTPEQHEKKMCDYMLEWGWSM